jgi:hypothetical protein
VVALHRLYARETRLATLRLSIAAVDAMTSAIKRRRSNRFYEQQHSYYGAGDAVQ